MRAIVIHCPNKECQKLLAKDAKLPVGAQFIIRCFHCRAMIFVSSTLRQGIVRIVDKVPLDTTKETVGK